MSYLDKASLKVVGTRPIRPDGVEKVIGRANFGADMTMPGMLWAKIKRSPHAHARIKAIHTQKALALPGVKAVVTAADFPEIASEEAFVGEGPMNFRDLSRNCMARGKALYEGHAVAAVAATEPWIAEEALDLIEVEYEVLPHVIDVEDAMRPDAPVLHDDLFTQGVDPKPTTASNVAKRITFVKGDVSQGWREAEVTIERRYTTPAGAPGLYRAACLRRLGRRRRAGHDLEFEPGPVHGARLLRQAARRRHGQYPRDPGRDRRRVRRQDAGLPGAGRAGAVEEGRAPGQDRDEPRGSVPRLRPGRRRRHRGQARRQEGRHDWWRPNSSSSSRPAPSRARRSDRPACAASRCTTSRMSASSATTSSRTGRRSPPTARPARRTRRSAPRAASTSWRANSRSTRSSCARSTPRRTAPRRRTGRPGPISATSRRSRRRRRTST